VIWVGLLVLQNSVLTFVDFYVNLYGQITAENRIKFGSGSRRRKGWTYETNKTSDRLNVTDIVYDISLSTKHVMNIVIDKLNELDNSEWNRELFNDRMNAQNGNKLRTYRLYKTSVETEPYIKLNISRMERRTMALFRAGSLPLAYETGRYSRPPIPVNERYCVLCDNSAVETEKHFLMECPLYTDLRYDLFYESAKYIENFDDLDNNQKFINIMNCSNIQHTFCKHLHKFFIRRRLFV